VAQLRLESGTKITDLNDIRNYLSPLNIELSHWPIEKTEIVGPLLKADTLKDDEKEGLLRALDSRFEEQKKLYGYQTRDLVVLHSQIPNLEQMLSIFDKTHRHSDDEVRYIIDGSGIFGFILPEGEQVLLTVEAEEYIRVPANTEHWFVLDKNRRIKAVRYFTSREGWVANYSGTPVRVEAHQ
jgi:1,2-dihydroxy-3-keto-5-methylthiopentene dioxygenase